MSNPGQGLQCFVNFTFCRKGKCRAFHIATCLELYRLKTETSDESVIIMQPGRKCHRANMSKSVQEFL